jgi:YaiO family outer membrane protein
MGRTYAWDQKYDSARMVLSKIIHSSPGHYDAIDALIDNEYYCDNLQESIKFADMGLSYHPNEVTFLFKKARSLNKLGDSGKASELLNHIVAIDPSDREALKLLLSIQKDKMVNKVSMDVSTDFFSDEKAWYFSSATYNRKTKNLGSVAIRYNYANRFGRNGQQLEFDAYPTVAKGVYIYFNTGISNSVNFPISRLTAEPYFKLPHGFEVSVGIRYMNFDKNHLAATDSNAVVIFTGTVGKYFGNYWLSVRPYLTPGNNAWSKSVNLTLRRYLDDSDSYVSLNLGTGVSPDVQQYAFDPGYYLKSNKIALAYRQKIIKRFFLDCGTGYAREETMPGVKRNRFSVNLGISYLF